MRSVLGAHFEVQAIGQGDQAARHTWELIEADGGQDVLGLGTVSDGVWQLARFRSAPLMAQLATAHSPAWQSLGVSILHVAVLDHLLPASNLGKPQCQYVHLVGEVTDAVARKQCGLAVLVPPATMKHVEQIAGNLEKMPPKSTYFYPKLLSGLVFNSLKSS
jgi:hypothetical protein